MHAILQNKRDEVKPQTVIGRIVSFASETGFLKFSVPGNSKLNYCRYHIKNLYMLRGLTESPLSLLDISIGECTNLPCLAVVKHNGRCCFPPFTALKIVLAADLKQLIKHRSIIYGRRMDIEDSNKNVDSSNAISKTEVTDIQQKESVTVSSVSQLSAGDREVTAKLLQNKSAQRESHYGQLVIPVKNPMTKTEDQTEGVTDCDGKVLAAASGTSEEPVVCQKNIKIEEKDEISLKSSTRLNSISECGDERLISLVVQAIVNNEITHEELADVMDTAEHQLQSSYNTVMCQFNAIHYTAVIESLQPNFAIVSAANHCIILEYNRLILTDNSLDARVFLKDKESVNVLSGFIKSSKRWNNFIVKGFAFIGYVEKETPEIVHSVKKWVNREKIDGLQTFTNKKLNCLINFEVESRFTVTSISSTNNDSRQSEYSVYPEILRSLQSKNISISAIVAIIVKNSAKTIAAVLPELIHKCSNVVTSAHEKNILYTHFTQAKLTKATKENNEACRLLTLSGKILLLPTMKVQEVAQDRKKQRLHIWYSKLSSSMKFCTDDEKCWDISLIGIFAYYEKPEEYEIMRQWVNCLEPPIFNKMVSTFAVDFIDQHQYTRQKSSELTATNIPKKSHQRSLDQEATCTSSFTSTRTKLLSISSGVRIKMDLLLSHKLREILFIIRNFFSNDKPLCLVTTK